MKQSFPFRLRGHDGSVAVEYQANDDPEEWGYGILGRPWPTQLAIGLPVLEATVSYRGGGYAAVFGWIQVVRIHVEETSESLVAGAEKAPSGDHVWVDGPPNLRGLGIPFLSFGPRPTLFDAPASTESDVRFVAESFLTASPDGLVSRISQPCFGLRWGYVTQKVAKGEIDAQVLPLELLGRDSWREGRPQLEQEFPGWSFEDWADEPPSAPHSRPPSVIICDGT